MKSRLLNQAPKTFALVFDKGDEVTATLLQFAKANQLKASYFTAIGALSDATLGFFERERKDYKRIEIEEQVEVMSLFGNLAQDESGQHKLHAHVVIGKRDGSAHGGRAAVPRDVRAGDARARLRGGVPQPQRRRAGSAARLVRRQGLLPASATAGGGLSW